MKRVVSIGVVTASALIAMALAGCVTEEIGPTPLHTTAYVEPDTPSADEDSTTTNAVVPSSTDPSTTSNGQSHH